MAGLVDAVSSMVAKRNRPIEISHDGTVAEGVSRAVLDSYRNGHVLVVCGSFFIMQEAR